MVRPLGKNQLDDLAILGSPSTFAIVGHKCWRSLARRGLLKPHGDDGDSFFAITPLGLRVLSDELENGRIHQELPKKRDGALVPGEKK